MLFLFVVIATPVAIFSAGLTAEKAIAALFAGFSASLFVFCFVEFIPKYYLSELLIIIVAFGFVMTLCANAIANQKWLLVAGLASILVPLATYYFLDWRRPENERLENKIPKPRERSPEQRLRSARNFLYINAVASTAVIASQIFSRAPLISWVSFVTATTLFNLHGSWKMYGQAKRDAQKSLDENPSP